ncbi:unnamed protein product [Schistocephalus solidus]|uniref:Galactosylgalactosylxylosylprotein 3-beta-glucuronosyltransferase n=1 Tax=Schistocephalus solidus TaxID=70667 RepID=A0A0X3P611_SCHSO|nr:unnamed protein product [Schistocephalus solidus]
MQISRTPASRCVLYIVIIYSLFIFFLLLIKFTPENSPKICKISGSRGHFQRQKALVLPKIFLITATYNRLEQTAELTRLCHTFLHVPNIHWLVIEDATNISSKVSKLLGRCGVPFTLLHAKTPAAEVQRPEEPRWRHARGVAQRNRGLRWLRENLVQNQDKGVVYMADDDNTYSLQLFDEIRTTKRVSTWPVAFVGGLPWEGCVTKPDEPHVIERMWSIFKPWRVFPVDMAGFAVNLDLILSHPTAEFVYHKKPGLLETEFLKQLGLRNFTEMEPKADGCKRVSACHMFTFSSMKN